MRLYDKLHYFVVEDLLFFYEAKIERSGGAIKSATIFGKRTRRGEPAAPFWEGAQREVPRSF